MKVRRNFHKSVQKTLNKTVQKDFLYTVLSNVEACFCPIRLPFEAVNIFNMCQIIIFLFYLKVAMAINDFNRCLSPTVLNCLYLLSSLDEGIFKSKMTRGNLRLNLSIVNFGTTIQELTHSIFHLRQVGRVCTF